MATSTPARACSSDGAHLRASALPALVALSALTALPAQAQAPTGQTTLSLTASAQHDAQYFAQTGVPAVTLGARLDASDFTGDAAGTYGSAQFATAVGEVSATVMKLRSFARAYAFTQSGYYSAGALAEANASASVPFRFVDPTRTGQAGTMVAPLLVTGDVVLDTGFYDLNNYSRAEGRAYVMLWGSGYGALDCGSTGANFCKDISSNSIGTVVTGSGATGSLVMQVPFAFGDWTQVHLQMWTRVLNNT